MMLGLREGDGPGELPGDDCEVRRMGLSVIPEVYIKRCELDRGVSVEVERD